MKLLSFLALFFFTTTLCANVQRLTHAQTSSVALDYADPSIPDFLSNGTVRVLCTNGIILIWKSADLFFKGTNPQVQFIKAAHPNGQIFNDDSGEDLWDPSIVKTSSGEEIMLAGVMTPPRNRSFAKWPEDHWNRRTYIFHKRQDAWVRDPQPLLHSIPDRPSWNNHNYGHEFLRDESGALFIFYERVTEERNGLPWKTEIFARRLQDMKPIGGEISILEIPFQPWPRSLRGFGGTLIEGPRPFKMNGQYYISFSAGDYDSTDYGIHLAVSKNLTGPYKAVTDEENDLRDFGEEFEKNAALTWGAGRGSYFQYKNKWWVIFHGTPMVEEVGFRHLFLAPAFEKDL